MADNIANIDGRYSFAYQGQTPWHKLGTRTAGMRDVDQAQELANLGYTVEMQPIYLADGRKVSGSQAIGRLDRAGALQPWAVVGDGYQIVQNSAAADILRPLTELGCTIETAGALGQGETVFMLAKLPEVTVTPVPGDDVRGYFLLKWAHDGSASVSGWGTPIRVVCQNTLNMAVNKRGGAAWVSIRHTTNAGQRLDEAANLLKGVTQAMLATGETYAAMARRRMGPAELAAFVAAIVPNEDPAKELSPVLKARRDTLTRLAFGGRGAEMANQLIDVTGGHASAWAAYNAVTEYVDHVRPGEAKSASGVQRANESALFGGNAAVKLQALTLARQLVAA